MQHLEVSGAVRPLKWTLGVKWLISYYLPSAKTVPLLDLISGTLRLEPLRSDNGQCCM
jgi:hypothetical protein